MSGWEWTQGAGDEASEPAPAAEPEPEPTYCFTYSELRTLLDSIRNGDGIERAMLMVEDGEFGLRGGDREVMP